MADTSAATPLRADSPRQAIDRLLELLSPLETETVHWTAAVGRVTAQTILADRPSPPSDVSAMDGYAIRLSDWARGGAPVAMSILPGRPASALASGSAARIMTGAVVPPEAELVVRREDVRELDERIEWDTSLRVTSGQNIRRRGENLPAGSVAVEPGRVIDAPALGAAVTFGAHQITVHKRVRVGLIVTGDELRRVEQTVEPWEIRDSNGPASTAMLSVLPWVQWVGAVRCPDDPAGLRQSTADMLRHVDALLLTGGVSMGTHDFVPGVLDESGCRVVFHRLPIRPGGPMLGAVGPQGQAVLGLPGNPLSVMTTLRRIGLPALRRLSGQRACDPPAPAVALTRPDGRSLKLWWYRPVVLETDGGATLVDSRGSGDVASAARSDGFVEIPPDQTGSGPWAYYRWSDG